MCCLTHNVTTDVDSLRSNIRDKSVRVIDVRRPEDYMRDHVPTSLNLPLADLLTDDSPSRVQSLIQSLGIDDETSVVIYDDTFGALASRVAWTLEYLGHTDVSLLDTTYSGWKSLGLESDSEILQVQHSTHSINLQSDILATSDYLTSVKEHDNVTLIDNRERLNYLEQHIPGAINLPYRTLADGNKILRSKSDLQRLLENRGVNTNQEIITYCGSVGTLSGLAYYAIKSAGIPNAKLYVRSFKEWKSLKKPTLKQQDANYWDLSAE